MENQINPSQVVISSSVAIDMHILQQMGEMAIDKLVNAQGKSYDLVIMDKEGAKHLVLLPSNERVQNGLWNFSILVAQFRITSEGHRKLTFNTLLNLPEAFEFNDKPMSRTQAELEGYLLQYWESSQWLKWMFLCEKKTSIEELHSKQNRNFARQHEWDIRCMREAFLGISNGKQSKNAPGLEKI